MQAEPPGGGARPLFVLLLLVWIVLNGSLNLQVVGPEW